MRHIFVTAIAAGAAVSFAAPATAQEKCFDKGTLTYVDCPEPAPAPAPAPAPVIAPPPPLWTGWYIGAHAGYAFGDIDGSVTAPTIPLDESEEFEIDGFLAGGQIGYLYQYANDIVVGIEIDGSAVFGDDDVSDNVLNFDYTAEAELDYLASARLRLGVAYDQWLPYLTAGVALAGYEASADIPGVASASVDDTVFGGVVGGGIEYMTTSNWVIGVEGLYYFFDGEEDVDFDLLGEPATGEAELDDVIAVRARISYKF